MVVTLALVLGFLGYGLFSWVKGAMSVQQRLNAVPAHNLDDSESVMRVLNERLNGSRRDPSGQRVSADSSTSAVPSLPDAQALAAQLATLPAPARPISDDLPVIPGPADASSAPHESLWTTLKSKAMRTPPAAPSEPAVPEVAIFRPTEDEDDAAFTKIVWDHAPSTLSLSAGDDLLIRTGKIRLDGVVVTGVVEHTWMLNVQPRDAEALRRIIRHPPKDLKVSVVN